MMDGDTYTQMAIKQTKKEIAQSEVIVSHSIFDIRLYDD